MYVDTEDIIKMSVKFREEYDGLDSLILDIAELLS